MNVIFTGPLSFTFIYPRKAIAASIVVLPERPHSRSEGKLSAPQALEPY